MAERYTYVSPVTGTWAAHGDNVFHAGRNVDRKGIAHRWHSGNDLNAKNGSIAVATIGGVIQYVGNNDGYGANMVVMGDDGNAYRYATHYAVIGKVGQRVEQGQQVGWIGEKHLHFEVIPPGSPSYKQMADPKKKGQFIYTKTAVGQKNGPTIDPMKFFGATRFQRISAGLPIGDPNRQAFVPVVQVAHDEVADTFGEVQKSKQVADAKLLAGVMLAEARGGGALAMQHVAQIAQNRVDDNSRRFPNSIREVLTQENQFAKPLDPSKLTAEEKPLFQQAYTDALAIMNRQVPATTDALFFATPKAAASNADFRKIAATEPKAGSDNLHVMYGAVKTTPLKMRSEEFGQYLHTLETMPDLQRAKLLNPRIVPEANWAAEAQAPVTVAIPNQKEPVVEPTTPVLTSQVVLPPSKPAQKIEDVVASGVKSGDTMTVDDKNAVLPGDFDNDAGIRKYINTPWEALPDGIRFVLSEKFGYQAKTIYETAQKTITPAPATPASFITPQPSPVTPPAVTPKSSPSVAQSPLGSEPGDLVPSTSVKDYAEASTHEPLRQGVFGEDAIVNAIRRGDVAGVVAAQKALVANATKKGYTPFSGYFGDEKGITKTITDYFTNVVKTDPNTAIVMKEFYKQNPGLMSPEAAKTSQAGLAGVPDIVTLPTQRPDHVSPLNLDPLPAARSATPAPNYIPDLSIGYTRGDKTIISGQEGIAEDGGVADGSSQPYNAGVTIPNKRTFGPLDIVLNPSPLLVSSGATEPVAPTTPDLSGALNLDSLPAQYHPSTSFDPTAALVAPVVTSPTPDPIPTPIPGVSTPALIPKPKLVPRVVQPKVQWAAPQGPAMATPQSNPLVQASGGGRPETTPMGNSIAVHAHSDGGTTTSYYASDGHIITIHTDANGDTNTVNG